MARSADSTPHFTTIAGFAARLDREIVGVYLEALLVRDEMGLIGCEMFAVDGVKMPPNASEEWSRARPPASSRLALREKFAIPN